MYPILRYFLGDPLANIKCCEYVLHAFYTESQVIKGSLAIIKRHKSAPGIRIAKIIMLQRGGGLQYYFYLRTKK